MNLSNQLRKLALSFFIFTGALQAPAAQNSICKNLDQVLENYEKLETDINALLFQERLPLTVKEPSKNQPLVGELLQALARIEQNLKVAMDADPEGSRNPDSMWMNISLAQDMALKLKELAYYQINQNQLFKARQTLALMQSLAFYTDCFAQYAQ